MHGDDQGGGGRGGGNGAPRAVSGPIVQLPEPAPEGLTLHDYLAVLWRRLWIIVLVVAVAAGSAWYFAARQPARYSTTASLIYVPQVDPANPSVDSYTDIVVLEREMATIGSVVSSPLIRAPASAALEGEKVDTSAGYSVSAQAQKGDTNYGSNIILVTGDSTDPELAAAAANAYALAYVDFTKEQEQERLRHAMSVVDRELALYTGKEKESVEYALLAQKRQDLELRKESVTGRYAVLSPAQVPSSPYEPQPMRSAVIGLGIGLFAAIGLVLLLEQFDSRVRRPEEVAGILRQPILGRVPRISHRLLAEGKVVAIKHPDGPVAEAFRMLRTNLEFMSVDQPVRSILVTSCIQGEGKSVAVSNLAVTLSMAGKRVVVVDADLRRPRQHEHFGIPNEKGVSTVATGRDKLYDSLQPVEVARLQHGPATPDFITAWAEDTDARSRLYVLPSGPIPPSPGEIVASRRFSTIIEQLTTQADIVLVDTPAMLPVGDTAAIAARVDGLIFLVDMHLIRRPQLLAAADQLARLPARMLGTIVRVSGREGRYTSYGYRYGYSYSQGGTAGRAPAARQERSAPDAASPAERPAPL